MKDKNHTTGTLLRELPESAAGRAAKRKRDKGLWLIGLFKLAKAALLLVVAIGALKLIHDDVAATVSSWVAAIRIDPDNRFIHRALVKLAQIDDKKLEVISAGSFVYVALLSIEGVGLLMEKRWAEYFTVITTVSLIPLEIYELVERFTALRVLILALNILVVVYLIVKLRERSEGRE